MSIALIAGGLLLLVAAIRNSQDTLFGLIAGEFKGTGNFLFWIIAIVLIGAIGYIPKLKGISVTLLTLIFVAIFLKKGQGFFDNIGLAAKSGNT